MNRTLVVVAFFVLGGIAVGGGIAIHLLNPEAQATFGNFVFTLLGLMVTAGATLGGINKVQEEVQEVKRQTNGRLHAKDAEIERKDRMLLDAGIDPQTGQPLTGPTPTT